MALESSGGATAKKLNIAANITTAGRRNLISYHEAASTIPTLFAKYVALISVSDTVGKTT